MIDILLATYNGQAFLPAQLDSLLHQTYQDFLIHIRDDGSADATLQIIEQYKTNYPGKISVLENPIPSGSAKSNFFHLLNEADMSGDYFLLCDQDDVWNPDKVELTLREMTKLEATYGTQTPLLIHTDLAVVDQSLRPLARSFVKYQNLKPSANTLPRLLVQNNITGCTLMGNRALFNACRTATPEDTASILMHDWWLGLIAAAFGRVAFLPVQAMQYRQHGGNQVGAKSARDVAYIRRQIHEKLKNKGKYTTTCAQAAAFANAFAAALTPAQKEMLQAYIALPNQPKIRRWRTVFRYSFWMQGLSRKIAQLLFG